MNATRSYFSFRTNGENIKRPDKKIETKQPIEREERSKVREDKGKGQMDVEKRGKLRGFKRKVEEKIG